MRGVPLSRGPMLALTSAALFGASTPFAKMLVGDVHPALLAAVLYLGSGLGLLIARSSRRLCKEIDPSRANARRRALCGWERPFCSAVSPGRSC